MFVADTGAAVSVLALSVYNKMEEASRPHLIKSAVLLGTGGEPIVETGKAIFDIQLGNLRLIRGLVVVEIEDDCLLGADILQNDSEGPGDLCLSEEILRLRGVEIPLICIGKLRKDIRKVIAAEDFFVPRQSEAVVYGYIEREADFTEA